MSNSNNNSIRDLRAILFDTIRAVKDDKDFPLERAKTVGELAQVIVNSAKTEVDFIRATNGKGVASGFLGAQPDLPAAPAAPDAPGEDGDGGLPRGIVGVRQHRISDEEPGQRDD